MTYLNVYHTHKMGTTITIISHGQAYHMQQDFMENEGLAAYRVCVTECTVLLIRESH